MKHNHVLITGANGFIGQVLTTTLLANGAKVSTIVRSNKYNIINSKKDNHLLNEYILDLMNLDQVKDLFYQLNPNYVVHLASSKDRSLEVKKFREIYNNNMSISLNVIDACLSIPNLERMIFIGSCDEYGYASLPYDEMKKEQPVNAYGLSKLATSDILKGLFLNNKFPSIILRPSIVYGPNQGREMFLSDLIQSLLENRDFPMTKGEQKRDFVYITDVVNAIVMSINAKDYVNGRVVNIGSGISYKIKDVVSMVAKSINEECYDKVNFGYSPYRKKEIMDYSVIIDRAEEILKWKPNINLQEGIVKTVEYFKYKK